MNLELRPLAAADEPLLQEYLYLALFVPEGSPPLPREIVREPAVARYLRNWGRPGDRGLLAMDSSRGCDLGAAWLRLWPVGDEGYGFVDYDTSELTMAVRPEYRGRGVGSSLLLRVLAEMDHLHGAVSLSVSDANTAIRLYRRHGFEPVFSQSGSTTMRRPAANG